MKSVKLSLGTTLSTTSKPSTTTSSSPPETKIMVLATSSQRSISYLLNNKGWTIKTTLEIPASTKLYSSVFASIRGNMLFSVEIPIKSEKGISTKIAKLRIFQISRVDGCVIKELHVKLGMTVYFRSAAGTMTDQQSGHHCQPFPFEFIFSFGLLRQRDAQEL